MMRKTIKTGKKKVELLNKEGAEKVEAPEVPAVAKAEEKPPTVQPLKKALYAFPKQTRFVLNGRISYVRDAYFADNTDMRLVFVDGTEEVIELRILRMEAQDDPNFLIIE